MRKIRHFDFYPDEWLTGTAELDAAERGLYITACSLIYSNGGAITVERLRAACPCDHGLAFSRQLRRLIELGKLTENGPRITNERCENEIRKSEERVAKAQRNGTKGGRPSGLAKPDGSSDEKLAGASSNHQPSTSKEEREEATAAANSESPIREAGNAAPPRAAAAPAAPDFAFEGRVIRLKQADFDRWKASFSAIPDLAAELRAIDDKLAERGHEGKWFSLVSAWLRAANERYIANPPRPNGSNGATMPAEFSHEWWRGMLRGFAAGGVLTERRWEQWNIGPPPGPRCRAPPEIAAEFGIDATKPLPRHEKPAETAA